MVLAILAFAAGIFLVQTSAFLPAWLPFSILGFACLLGARMIYLNPIYQNAVYGRFVQRFVLIASCALIGVSWGSWRAEFRLAQSLSSQWEGQDIKLVGRIAKLPQKIENGVRFIFDVEQIVTEHAVVPKRIMLSWYKNRKASMREPDNSFQPQAGERWHFVVRLKRPHSNINPHGFDYEAWLLERDIRATGYIRSYGDNVAENKRLTETTWHPIYLIERYRQYLRTSFDQALPRSLYPYGSILSALVIGDQQSISDETWQVFRRTGVIHLLSVSGLHVTMVAALFGTLISWLWRRSSILTLRVPAQRAAVYFAWSAAFAYTLLAGFAVPTQRTLYMLSVAALAILLRKNINATRTLSLALFVVLLLDPWAILAPGFWLSFGIVSALLYVNVSIVKSKQITTTWKLNLLALIRHWGVAQWTATLAALPILLLSFYQVPLASPLANMLAIPWVGLIVTPLSLISAILPYPILKKITHELLSWLMQFLEWCAALPVWSAPEPPLPAVIVGLFGIVLMLLPRGMPIRLFGIFLLLPVLFWPEPQISVGDFRLTILDVGQGSAAAIETADGVILYDTGPKYNARSDAGMRVVMPWLNARGVKQLQALVVTHKDIDHSGGMYTLLENVQVEKLMTSFKPKLRKKGQSVQKNMQYERCLAGTHWSSGGVKFHILHPAKSDYQDTNKSNHLSCVLRVEGEGGSVLLTADIEREAELALIERVSESAESTLEADVLMIPHHGSKTSSTPEFIEAVDASDAIVSAGYKNRYRHPNSHIMRRYSKQTVWRTDLQGAITVDMLRTGVTINARRLSHRRYWH